jgi:hypothetical protein
MVLKLIIAIILCINIANAQELKIVTPEEFLNQSPTEERSAILDSIVHQFDGKSVTQKQLDNIWNDKKIRNKYKLIRFQIVNQKLYAGSFDITHLYFVILLEYFQKFVKQYKIQDVDFIIHASDEIIANSDIDFPSFIMSKDLDSPYEKNKLLIPDAYMVRKNWRELAERIKQSNKNKSWKNKINKVFWRGNASGGLEGAYQLSNFDKLPRLSLVLLSKLYPDIINARFTQPIDSSFNQSSRDLAKILELLFGSDFQKVDPIEHLNYKYLISIDGNTCAWERVPWIMLSNSILLKQETNKIEWFYKALKPYVHYVPVNKSLTNIFEQIQWMKENDPLLEKISQNAQEFIINNLMPQHIDSHMAIILNQYHNIQKDKRIIPTLEESENAISLSSLLKNLLNRVIKYFTRWF